MLRLEPDTDNIEGSDCMKMLDMSIFKREIVDYLVERSKRCLALQITFLP